MNTSLGADADLAHLPQGYRDMILKMRRQKRLMESRQGPMSLLNWTEENEIAERFAKAGLNPLSIFNIDPDTSVTAERSRMLHLAAMHPSRPSKEVIEQVFKYLLEERRADPNVPDNYGHTALTLFLILGCYVWTNDDAFGCRILSLLLHYGADVNVPFTPGSIAVAGCDKWTLAHDLNHENFGRKRHRMPVGMREILEPLIDWTARDSAGRIANRGQLLLDL